jgi:hypothetical protein
MSVRSYPSLYAIGHKAIRDIFDGDVVIQEKVDGSQFSFQIRNGEVEIRSKGAQLNIVAPDKMFAAGVAAVMAVAGQLREGLIYRGEYLRGPKHNTLAYDRTPKNHVALFDIEDTTLGEGYFLTPPELKAEAERLGFDVVPTLLIGKIDSPETLRAMLDQVSLLGGAKIEGVVVKNYAKFTEDKKVMMGKFVSEAFKEVHVGEWRKANPTQGDVTSALIAAYRTPARWAKAVQHLREAGQITDTPKDIGHLIKEVGEDVQRECEAEIKDMLFSHFWPNIRRGLTGGLPEWYKEQIMAAAFEKPEPEVK